jgi:hypothetical protein
MEEYEVRPGRDRHDDRLVVWSPGCLRGRRAIPDDVLRGAVDGIAAGVGGEPADPHAVRPAGDPQRPGRVHGVARLDVRRRPGLACGHCWPPGSPAARRTPGAATCCSSAAGRGRQPASRRTRRRPGARRSFACRGHGAHRQQVAGSPLYGAAVGLVGGVFAGRWAVQLVADRRTAAGFAELGTVEGYVASLSACWRPGRSVRRQPGRRRGRGRGERAGDAASHAAVSRSRWAWTPAVVTGVACALAPSRRRAVRRSPAAPARRTCATRDLCPRDQRSASCATTAVKSRAPSTAERRSW